MLWTAVGILLGIAWPLLCSAGQALPSAGAARQASRTPSARPAAEILREIDDPSSGQRWLLVRDDAHPGGPGLLLPAGPGRDRIDRRPAATSAQAVPLLIRAGDHVELEEHSATVDALLDAIALTPAVRGSAFHARLAIGGRVVQAVATAPGRAGFAAESEASR